MFTAKTPHRSAPMTSPIFAVVPQGTTLSGYLENFRAPDLTTKAFIGSTILLLAKTSVGDDETELKVNCDKAFYKGAARSFIKLFTDEVVPVTTPAPSTDTKAGSAIMAALKAGSKQEPVKLVDKSAGGKAGEKGVAGVESGPAVSPDVGVGGGGDDDDGREQTEEELLKSNIEKNLSGVVGWFIDLMNAAKGKPLEDRNVEGYFASIDHSGTKPASVAIFINNLIPFFPDMVGEASFRESLYKSVWTDYRNTRVSTGKVLAALLPDFRKLSITKEGDANEVLILASAESPWDIEVSRRIPSNIRAYGAIFLEASGRGLDKWYQGNKAIDDLPAASVKNLKEVFKKYLEVSNNVEGLDKFTKVSDFDTDAVKNLF